MTLLAALFVVALASPCFTQYKDEALRMSERDEPIDRRQQPALLLVRNLKDDGDNGLREDSKERGWMPLPLQVREKRSPWKGGRGGGACCGGGGGRPWGGKPGGGGGWGGGGGGGGAWATSSAGSWGGGYGGGKGYGR